MAPTSVSNGVEAPRFEGITRPYSPEDVKRLQGSLKIENTLALEGSKKLWVRSRPSLSARFCFCVSVCYCIDSEGTRTRHHIVMSPRPSACQVPACFRLSMEDLIDRP